MGGLTESHFEAARDDSIEAMRWAVQTVELYRDLGTWNPYYSFRWGSDFSTLVRLTLRARESLGVVNDALIQTKPDNTPVRSGSTVSATGHGVAVKFANTACGVLTGVFQEHHADDHDQWVRYMEGDIPNEVVEPHKAELAEGFADIEVVDSESLYFVIQAEAAKAIRELTDAETRGRADGKTDTSKKNQNSLPKNPAVIRLHAALNKVRDDGQSDMDIARETIDEKDNITPESALRKVRKFREPLDRAIGKN